MNKNEMLQQCLGILAKKRAKAQTIAYSNLMTAKKHPKYQDLDKQEKDITFEIGKLRAFERPYDVQSDKLKEIKLKKQAILTSLNLTEDDLEPKYTCKKCNDVGYISRGMCSCLSSMLNKLIVKEYGSGKEKLNDFKDFNPNIAVNEEHKTNLLKIKTKFEGIATEYPDIPQKFIVLSGKTGVGKTFISECLAKALIDKGFLVSFISAFGMNNLFLNYHTSFDEQKQSYINALLDPDVIVIDDLGTEPMLKNVTSEYLYLILSERSRLNKLTIITTNLDPNEIMHHYNERIFSRLFHKKESLNLMINGNDLRIPKLKS